MSSSHSHPVFVGEGSGEVNTQRRERKFKLTHSGARVCVHEKWSVCEWILRVSICSLYTLDSRCTLAVCDCLCSDLVWSCPQVQQTPASNRVARSQSKVTLWAVTVSSGVGVSPFFWLLMWSGNSPPPVPTTSLPHRHITNLPTTTTSEDRTVGWKLGGILTIPRLPSYLGRRLYCAFCYKLLDLCYWKVVIVQCQFSALARANWGVTIC